LRFETVSALGVSNGAYADFGAWIAALCTAAGLENVTILPESKEGKPIVVAEWIGSDPDLPCIFLNSHYDVVPVMHDFWTVPPFQGLRKDGKVYGRGAQDMKCVCVQYLIALQRLRSQGFQPRRTVRLSYVPDEEIGGADGMGVLLKSEWFQSFKIGLALDEVRILKAQSYRFTSFTLYFAIGSCV
jgi:aminoacylase